MLSRLATPMMCAIVMASMAACVSTGPESQEESRKAAKTNTELGQQYLQRGQYEIALEKLRRAIAQDKTYAPAHTVLAFLYEQIGEDDLAEGEYHAAVRYDPDDGSTNNNYAAFLCARGKAREAEPYFAKALKDPFYDTPELALSNAGICELGAGNLDKAEKFLRQSLEYDQNLPASLLALGKLHYQRGDYFRARAFLQRYEAVADQNGESLDLGYRIETELGDREAAQAYMDELARDYPELVPKK